MKSNTLYLLLLFAGLGCKSTPVKPLKGDFYVRVVEGKLKAEANFTNQIPHDTTALTVTQVTFDGSPMKPIDVGGKHLGHYTIQSVVGTEDIAPHFFVTKLNADQEVRHELPMQSMDSVYFIGPLSKSKGGKVMWKGKPLSAQENLVLMVSNANGQMAEIELSGPSKGNELVLTSPALRLVQPGRVSFYAIRKFVTAFKGEKIFGKAVSEVYSKDFPVEIVE